MASLGSSGVYMNPDKVDIYYGDLRVVENGQHVSHNRMKLEQIMEASSTSVFRCSCLLSLPN